MFLATDLFLFVFFWELMLVPMYFLIDIWGHENRHKAAVKFFLFTQVGGLLMLVAIIALAVLHALATGVWTFALQDLMGTVLSPVVGMLLMLGFFAAFAVKLPAFPLHTWLPDAHTEAPTAGSVILAGLLLKTGGYGLIRFAVPLFPAASRAFAPVAIALAAAGIVYGGIMAFSQKDMKRVVAYTSVSHLGFVLLGVYAFTPQALSGAVLQMVSHGISTGALFMLVGALQDRIHTRDLDRMGGLWAQVPRMGAAALVLCMALVGLPGSRELRLRVPRPGRNVAGEPRGHGRRGLRPRHRHGLRAAALPDRVPRRAARDVGPGRPQRAGNRDTFPGHRAARLLRPVPDAHPEHGRAFGERRARR